jgi:hypothetical protein
MKSLLYVLLAVTLACALAGCAEDTTQQASATTPQPAENAGAAPASAPPADAKAAESKPAPKPADVPVKPAAPRTFTVPEGTPVTILLNDPISTARNKAGDKFTASLADPIVVNGETIVPRGASVNGTVVDAEGSGRVKGKASIRLTLNSIAAGGKTYPITTRPFEAEAEATKGRDAGVIAGGGGIGAAIGALAGGKKGAATGAIIGGAAGTGAVLATKGKEVEFNSETKLNFTLEKSTELPRLK